MEREQQIIAKVCEQGLLPLFYHPDTTVCLRVAEALYEAGVRTIEFTNRGEAATKNFKALVDLRNTSMKDLLLATGTIKTAEQARRFIDLGADFLISPFFDAAVCDEAYLQKKPWVPGCSTPTEIHVAEQAGCKLIKLFPGNTLRPGFMESIRPLFPELRFVVTGGVETSEGNVREWFGSGVAAIGLGSKLITNSIVESGDFGALTNATKNLLELIRQIK